MPPILQLLARMYRTHYGTARRLMSVPVRVKMLRTGWQNIGGFWYWCFW